MKFKRLFVWAALVSLMLLLACSLRSPPVVVPLTCDDFTRAAAPTSNTALISKEVTVDTGTPFTVALCSNPGTGYSWEEPRVTDVSTVRPVEHQVMPAARDLVGAPGTETWTFQALKPGATMISFAYSRPWPGGEKGTWQVHLQVTVR